MSNSVIIAINELGRDVDVSDLDIPMAAVRAAAKKGKRTRATLEFCHPVPPCTARC